MFQFGSLAAVLVSAGCGAYKVPLVEKPELPVDKALVGSWEAKKENGDEYVRLLVMPMSPEEYLLVYSEDEKTLYGRACHCGGLDFPLAQLKLIAPKDGIEKFDGTDDLEEFFKPAYDYATYAIKDGKLTVRLLNYEVVKPGEIKTSADLLAAIKANAKNPELFNEEKMVFTRVKLSKTD